MDRNQPYFIDLADGVGRGSLAQCAMVDSLIASHGFPKIVCALALMASACTVNAQTYAVGSDASTTGRTPTSAAQTSSQPLGWGSNIQNARLARAAELALQHGEYAVALDYAERALKATPNDPGLCFLVGYAARLNAKYQQSVDAYTRGLRLSPSALDGLSGLAQTYSLMGRTEDAKRLLRQVVLSDPRRKDDALLLGDLSMRSGNYTEALQWLKAAERIQPGARSELLMAICYQHLKQMDMASRYLDMARRRDPNSPDLQRSLAGYYRATGDYSKAIAALVAIRNPKPDVMAELAYTYELDGKLADSAREYATAANAVPGDVSLQLSAAQAEFAAGFTAKANPFLQRAATLDADSYRLHSIRGEIAQSEDREQDAVLEYSAALQHLPATPVEGPLYGIQLHMDLVDLYHGLNNKAAADQQLRTAQTEIASVNDQGAGRAQFLRLRALIKMNSGDYTSALADTKDALAIDAEDRAALQLNGDILMRLGRTDEAIASYKQILAHEPDSRSALTSLGYASRVAGRDLDAERYFRRLAAIDPSSYIPYLALGDLDTTRHQYTKAQSFYSKGYALAPGKVPVVVGGMNAAIEARNMSLAGTWLSRVTTAMQQEPQVLRETERYLRLEGKYQESATVGREAIQVLPKDTDVVVYLGYDLLHLEQYDELLSLTSKYLNIFPKDADIPLLEGYVHKHEGQVGQAEKDFTEALKRNPEAVTAYVNRGYMRNDLHLPKAAAADFEAALKREPNNGEAHLGLAYANLDQHRPEAALREANLAEKVMGGSRDIHIIRATAYGQRHMLPKAAAEYRAALKFTPDDGALHLGLGNVLFAERQYHGAVDELHLAEKYSPESADVDALLARSYAALQDREQTLHYVHLAELHAQSAAADGLQPDHQSEVLLQAGEALSTLGDQKAAMECFRKALIEPNSNRVGVRVAVAGLMAQHGNSAGAERQIALAQMEAATGATAPATGSELIAASDVFRYMHDYQLSQTYVQRAKAAGAPDEEVRIGMANNYLALGDTVRARAELSAVRATADDSPDYQDMLARASVLSREHHGVQALTAFAQASNDAGEDTSAEQSMLQAGADEGLRVTRNLSVLSDFSVDPLLEDTSVYVLDSKLDASFPVPISDTSLLPPPRSSIQTQGTGAYHLHLRGIPTASGLFQIRNARGQISVPATNSIVNRSTTDYIFNAGLNPTIQLGNNIVTFNSGIQATVRRDSISPIAMNQNLLREFTYMSTSSFFNVVSASAYFIHESGPFTESNLHSQLLTGAVDFRVGAPWGKTALITGWGANKQNFSPVNFKNYFTSSYVGIEEHLSQRVSLRAVAEDVRAWRVVGANSGIAQILRPAGAIDFSPNHHWDLHASAAYSSNRSFHVYDAIQNGLSVSYERPFRRSFNDGTGAVVLEYPIRFSAGFQQETFFNFSGGNNQQFRPYVSISLF